MSKIEIEIPEGKRAEWVGGVLTLVDEEPIEYKFKVGDKVKITIPNNPQYGEIVGLSEYAGEPLYTLKNGDANFGIYERYLELAPQSITERIKTFEDACEWCEQNNKMQLIHEHLLEILDGHYTPDLIAYLKLRIITCALNEGWEPKIDSDTYRYRVLWDAQNSKFRTGMWSISEQLPKSLLFRTQALAEYAAKQFKDIYLDFCGCKKGGEG